MKRMTARSAVMTICLIALCTGLLLAGYTYQVGDDPSGKSIDHPYFPHSWNQTYMLGPATDNHWAFDDQGVSSQSPGTYNIYLQATGTWTDKDNQYDAETCQYIGQVDDDPYNSGSGVWWSDEGADGTFTDQSADPTQYIPGATGSTTGYPVSIKLWMRDQGKWSPGNSNDPDNAVDEGTVYIFDSHLSRDNANVSDLNTHNCEPTALCAGAAWHAWNGTNPGDASTSLPPWSDRTSETLFVRGSNRWDATDIAKLARGDVLTLGGGHVVTVLAGETVWQYGSQLYPGNFGNGKTVQNLLSLQSGNPPSYTYSSVTRWPYHAE